MFFPHFKSTFEDRVFPCCLLYPVVIMLSICLCLFCAITKSRRLTNNVQGVKAHVQNQGEDHGCLLPPQASLQDWVLRGQALAAQCTTLLQQLAWLLQCCPEDPQKKEEEEASSCRQHTLRCPSPLAAQRQPPGCLMRRGDAAWCQLHQRVTGMLKRSESVKTELDSAAQQASESVLHTWYA